MLGNTWYFGLIRKYTSTVGTLFNDIHILREDKEGNDENQLLKVPLVYSVKEKVLARINQDPTIDREYAMIAPIISFELLNMEYDPSRKMATIDRISTKSSDNNKRKFQYNPVAYNFNYRVTIYVKNTSDGLKIIEQILPMFTPDITVSADLIPEMNRPMDLPIVLNGIQMTDIYEGDFRQRKMFTYDLSITLKGYLFGPIKESSVIKFANSQFYIPSTINAADGIGKTPMKAKVLVTPGLTANGTPTSNSSISISPNDILVTDDFGFCTDITEIIND